jgi:trans-aconitate 2-methyltransferase
MGSWDGALYAANTAHHRAHDTAVLSVLDLRASDRVLDIGCGVGDLTVRVAGLVPDGEVVGLDPSPSLLATARAQHVAPNLRFVEGTAQRLTAAVAGPFDVVLSTAALHWVPAVDQPAVLRGVFDVLRPGGLLRVDMGGAGQIAAVLDVLDPESLARGGPVCPWFFPGPQAFRQLLETAGLEAQDVRLVRQRRAFPDGEALLGWLRSQVVQAYEPALPPTEVQGFQAAVERRALAELRRQDGSYDLDFVRLAVLARRPL